jgi:molecular chaperone DnaK (HSP70)
MPRYVGMGAREAKYQYQRGRSVFYSVKQDLGTDREPFYTRAIAPDLNTPVKVSAAILRSMREAAEAKLGIPLKRVPVVITVPASFQSAQRRDTVCAARLAGFDVSEQCLFDEPNAALLAYMNRRRVQGRWGSEETVLVFDFGGGTCDVSITDVSFAPVSRKIHLRNLAISRYEELGGDNIDKHIVHTLLAPYFYKKMNTTARDWSLTERKSTIWSQLGRIAEALKTRLCEEVDKIVQIHGWDMQRISQVSVALPPQTIMTSRGEVLLDQLELNATAFQQIMTPFLAPDGAFNSNHEYYRVTSIITPIVDALEKAGLTADDISKVLLVGGSARNPWVERALADFFRDATLDHPADLDTLVAEGAALQAYWQHVIGHDLLAPIVGDTIGLLTEGNAFVPLVKAGSLIPFPSHDEWHVYTQFRVPRDLMQHVNLVICAGSAARPVHSVRLTFSQMVARGTPVHLRVRLDGNKIFHLEAFLPDHPNIRVSESIDNPLGMLPMTPLEQERAKLEAILARAQQAGTLDSHVETMETLARTLRQLGRYESALDWVVVALRRCPTDIDLRLLRASLHYDLGERAMAHAIWAPIADEYRGESGIALSAAISAPDLETREKYTRQAMSAAPGDGIVQYFMSTILSDKGDHEDARRHLNRARAMLEEKISVTPTSVDYSYLAAVYERLGLADKAQMMRERQRALEQQPSGTQFDSLVGITTELAQV